ncbi:MAG: trimethylamine methyltransferase family protein [Candidatus Coatesbacteria bacterium]
MKVEALTQVQILRIHAASLAILERVGVEVPHEEILNRFSDTGAKVDHATKRVRIPPALVEKLVAGAGKTFTLAGRDATRLAEFGRGKRNYNATAGEAYWIDEPGKPRRWCSLQDVATAARFGDALPNITIPGAMSDPHELPVAARCVEVAATMLRNTTKPVYFWFHDRASARFLVEIAVAVRGTAKEAAKAPPFMPFFEPISPLRFPFNGIDLLFETARAGLPVPVGPMAQMGLSAPATRAGTMALENAEVLAGICITQLIKPGLPVCHSGICHAFDMATTQMIFGGPEQAVFGVAMTQMGKSYGLPVYINVGLTDSKRPDAQAGLEAGITLAYGAAAGADIFGHMGISGVDQASSLDLLAFQDEVISYVEGALRHLDVSDDALGLDAIAEVGPGGSFIDTDHTAEHFRRETWFPKFLDRQFYEAWIEGGAKSTEERCRARTREILEKHRPEPVPASLDRELTRIVDAAKKELDR